MKIRARIELYIFKPDSFLGLIIAQNSKIARKMMGGHWEHVEIGDSIYHKFLWIPKTHCSKLNHRYRTAYQIGEPECEDYPLGE